MPRKREYGPHYAYNRARSIAIRRLIALHREEFDVIYAEEAAKQGVRSLQVIRKQRVEKLQEEIRRLKGEES